MDKKQLYMIGNSHIDPVWFWKWEEGMQEVKATFASALARMKEYPDFKFTSTSTAFFEWIERILPSMFEEIKERIEEGRWELTGGWFIEPDCILPSGESFVRQGLYGQRYLKQKFNKICKIGSNVDSFGHNPMLPQILKGSGMDAYVFMRPRLNTPVFKWESKDGSCVHAICLPGEYTTWFHDPTVQNIQNTLERTSDYSKMVCCYGVGNHGGGPTIENIESIHSLEGFFPDTHLKFSTYTEFLEDTEKEELPIIRGAFEKVNVGCYSIDSLFKKYNRLAEKLLGEVDILLSMEVYHSGSWMKETSRLEGLWKSLLFNQFHDTLGGTITKEAREMGMMQLSSVCSETGNIKAIAIQGIMNQVDTRGEGFPLFLFQLDGNAFEDEVEVELNWFCKSPLCLLDPMGNEVDYQRIHTEAKTRNYNIGGRRRIVFRAQVPAFGYSIYRVVDKETFFPINQQMEISNENPYVLENAYIRLLFDKKTGMISSLVDKTTNFDALCGKMQFSLYQDERDAWGGLQGRPFQDREIEFQLESIEKVESGRVREVVRVRHFYEGTKIEQLYILGTESKEVKIATRLHMAHPWSLLKLDIPIGKNSNRTKAETSYGIIEREVGDGDEYFMHRFLDVAGEGGGGLLIGNDSKYAFNMEDGKVKLTLARSAIYAQGNSVNWYNEKESYRYHDMGEQEFHMVIRPHGNEVCCKEMYRIGVLASESVEYMADSVHEGVLKEGVFSLASIDKDNIRLEVLKKAEDDTDMVIRMMEMEGIHTDAVLTFGKVPYGVALAKYEIATYKLNTEAKTIKKVNFLEWNM